MTTLTASKEPAGISVAVFCGARTGTPAATAAAREVGMLLGRGGHRLIYGGGASGLMGDLAWSARKHGAEILGVVPDFLHERDSGVVAPPQNIRITPTLGERKAIMLDEADAFIALPGGYGTIDEVLDVLALTCLHAHRKPIVLLQTGDEWKAFTEALDALARMDYADPLPVELFHVVGDAARAVEFVTSAVPAAR